MRNKITIFFLLLVNFAIGQSKGTGICYFDNIAQMAAFTPNDYDCEIAKVKSDESYYNFNRNTGFWESLIAVTTDVKVIDFYVKTGVTDSLCVQLSTGIDYCQSGDVLADILRAYNHMNTSQVKNNVGDLRHEIRNGKHIYVMEDPDDNFEIEYNGITLFSIGN